jgi:hypothetical protein
LGLWGYRKSRVRQSGRGPSFAGLRPLSWLYRWPTTSEGVSSEQEHAYHGDCRGGDNRADHCATAVPSLRPQAGDVRAPAFILPLAALSLTSVARPFAMPRSYAAGCFLCTGSRARVLHKKHDPHQNKTNSPAVLGRLGRGLLKKYSTLTMPRGSPVNAQTIARLYDGP